MFNYPASPLLIRFFRAVTRARAAAEDARIKRIEELSDGGLVIYERIEENPKTGLKAYSHRETAGARRLAQGRVLRACPRRRLGVAGQREKLRRRRGRSLAADLRAAAARDLD